MLNCWEWGDSISNTPVISVPLTGTMRISDVKDQLFAGGDPNNIKLYTTKLGEDPLGDESLISDVDIVNNELYYDVVNRGMLVLFAIS